MSLSSYHFTQGSGPLLVSMPHVGTRLPDDIAAMMTTKGRAVEDTDWYVDRLYNFLDELGISVLQAKYSRYVIDLNRGADGATLYPGKSETELCPTSSFDNHPLYQQGYEPDTKEISRRQQLYWQPYHDKIQAELDRIKQQFGFAILWDAHSIQSHVPRFFEGRLPDLNLGTADGASCDPDRANALYAIAKASPYTAAFNGRFKGGFITRTYGNPADNIHAVQMEISQTTYMDEAPDFDFQADRAEKLRPTLKAMIESFLFS